MAKSPEELAHLEWLGYVQPVGLVVSVPAMLEAQCYVNKNIMAAHQQFLSCLPRDKADVIIPELPNLAEFTQKVLEWDADDLRTIPPKVALTGDMSNLEVVLPQYHETLRPTHAVPTFKPKEGEAPWTMLVQQLSADVKLDQPGEADSARHWNASPQAKFERLLRETEVPIGLLFNHRQLRLVYAPRGESSGYATFNVAEMAQVAGRPMFAALHMLLSNERMFALGPEQRLPAILQNSRKYQNTVSTKLAEQVLAALYELMRGFQAANDVRHGDLLREILANNPQHVYNGLLTVLMRLVFVLYAEDRELISSDPIYSNHYSVTGLFERLRSDAGRFPDTMDSRYGAWSQLLTLFRLVYEGGGHGDFRIPRRNGYLFDPDRYPFLEGRFDDGDVGINSPQELDSALQIPRVSDGVIFRVLKALLILDGERLSYRSLDVEQIGSVYETVMGFNLEVAAGKSIAIRPTKSHGAPATINLDELLETKPKDRAKWLQDQSDQKLGKEPTKLLKDATSIDELLTALDKKIAKKVTPRVVPAGAIVLQPSDERRRSGSHYTPRSLTEPIVRTTLEPILKQLLVAGGELLEEEQKLKAKLEKSKASNQQLATSLRQLQRRIEHAQAAADKQTPHPAQILDLKICDPAMGSGAFLVEACRQLGDKLVEAWHAHYGSPLAPLGRGVGGEGFPDIPPDEDEILYARRLVAQRCLYGVDKNPMAVDLAKLSLWLVTLAKDHPFTFLDHALRHGDSLVGLTREQIIGFHWEPKKQKSFGEDLIQKRLDRATEARAKILNAREDAPYRDQEQRLAVANEALNVVRLTGDACVSAFFAGSKKKQREDRCEELFASVSDWYGSGHDISQRGPIAAAAASLRTGEHPLPPFHWEIEFPEVFSRENGGFDAFVGNPPFLGGKRVSTMMGDSYRDWCAVIHEGANKNSDLVAHFFRRAYTLIRVSGTLGLIATNTIRQGDTRSTGLRWIVEGGGTIYHARRRLVWPGLAAVVVSVVHIAKGTRLGPFLLDNRNVETITAYLFHAGGSNDPQQLTANDGKSYIGNYVLGMGFTFDPDPGTSTASTIEEMKQIIANDPRNQELIVPYIGGQELNNSPTHAHERFVINFGNMSEDEAARWPDLYEVVKRKVKPERITLKRKRLGEYWWQFAERQPSLQRAKANLSRVLVCSRIGNAFAFTFIPSHVVANEKTVVFTFDSYGPFAVIQSRIHESWARFLSSTLKDDLQYTPTDCLATFPFPNDFDSSQSLCEVGGQYFAYRSAMMQKNDEGLTDTYNRFHDPHEKSPEILKLRELHAEMDRAVLEAYGWHDLAATAHCEFLLDYEEEDDDSSPTTDNQQPATRRSRKKKPWRLRWPDDFRDEVLARLLELNEQRHQEELLTGQATTGKSHKTDDTDNESPEDEAPRKPRKKRASKKSSTKDMF